jgi:hypothetical protein
MTSLDVGRLWELLDLGRSPWRETVKNTITDKLQNWYYSKNIEEEKSKKMGWDERIARIDMRNIC